MKLLTTFLAYTLVIVAMIVLAIPLLCYWLLTDDDAKELRTKPHQKNWDTCPYTSHANDCDCRGMGGDR